VMVNRLLVRFVRQIKEHLPFKQVLTSARMDKARPSKICRIQNLGLWWLQAGKPTVRLQENHHGPCSRCVATGQQWLAYGLGISFRLAPLRCRGR
jgi:hypothetical protein